MKLVAPWMAEPLAGLLDSSEIHRRFINLCSNVGTKSDLRADGREADA